MLPDQPDESADTCPALLLLEQPDKSVAELL